MRAAVQYVFWLIGLPLELLIIAALVRGTYRRFPIIFIYLVTLFLASVVDLAVFTASFSGIRLAHTRAFYYWMDQGVLQLMVYSVVISLIYGATGALRSRTLIRTILTTAAVLFAGGSFLIHYDPDIVVGMWMTLWSRDLNFASAILDLALWAMLLSSRTKDTGLLLLSGGLGIEFTGEAIGQSVRQWLPWALSPGDVIIGAANLACLWIWWQALRTAPSLDPASVKARPPVG
jgi:uncharacterized membrane protein